MTEEFDFGSKIREYRKKNKMTQAQLAKKIGVSRPLISLWEKNVSYPSIDRVYDIAKALEIDVENIGVFFKRPKIKQNERFIK